MCGPVGVLEGLGRGHPFQRLPVPAKEGTAGGGEQDALEFPAVAALQALEDRRVFRVHRHDLRPGLSGPGHDQRAGTDQGLLVGQGDPLAGVDGGQGGGQTGDAHQGRDRRVCLGQPGGGQHPLLPGQHLDVRVCQPGRQSSGSGGVRGRCQEGMEGTGLLFQQVDVVMGRQGQHPVAAGCGHLQGLGADGPGRAQNGQVSHAPPPLLKAGSQWMSSSTTGAQKITLSNRSSIPPCPGRIQPKSFSFLVRLK